MSGRLPILSLQIVQQRNLLFQLVESLATHGLLASIGRIRQSALRSHATMVGARKKDSPCRSGPDPTPHPDPSPLCPSTQGGWIGQACRILAVRCCLFGRVTGADPITGLLSTMQAVVPGRR